MFADGIEYVEKAEKTYDLIIVDRPILPVQAFAL